MPHTPSQLVLPGKTSTQNLHLVAEDTLTLHLLEFTVSQSTKPGVKVETVIHHYIHTGEREPLCGHAYLSLQSHRAAWLALGDDYKLVFSTLTFQDCSKDYLEERDKNHPLPLGSFTINYNLFELHLGGWNFDEVSGQFCLLVESWDGNQTVLLVDRLKT